jgi:protein TonB
MVVKKYPEVDVSRNSGLYFSVGLCLMLFISYSLLEYKTYEKSEIALEILAMEDDLEDETPLVNVETPPPPPPPKAAPEVIVIVEDVVEVEETVIESTEMTQEDIIEEVVAIEDVEVDEVDEDIEVPFAAVEGPPVFPGCEGLPKDQMKACFQAKIQLHVKNNFRYPERAIEAGVNGKVFVLFVIDANGKTGNIRTRGPAAILEKEAARIISLLPQMKPGNQRGIPVKVGYALPINFKLENM